jgi:hypothetical protein
MEAISSPETSADFQRTTQRYIQSLWDPQILHLKKLYSKSNDWRK